MKRYLPLCLLLLSISAHGALVKWVDAEGKVHYSDGPPPDDVKAQILKAPPAASGVPAQKSVAEREAEWRRNRKAGEEAAQSAVQQQEDALARKKDCDALRANLGVLENSPRISIRNANGESVIMDDATREQQTAEIRKLISANCN